jgi:hypothetical protein
MPFRGLAVPHLPNFKALELRVIQIQRIVVFCRVMRGPKRL